jgi:hypothetical protein
VQTLDKTLADRIGYVCENDGNGARRLPRGSKSWSTLGYNEVRRQPNQFCSVCALAAYIGCPAIIYADIITWPPAQLMELPVERLAVDE